MRVTAVTTTPDAYKQQQYYAGTHLAMYPNLLTEQRAIVVTEVENSIFKRYLEKANGQRDLLTTSSTREKMFLEKRIEHQIREELMQRLNYMNGVHYSAANATFLQQPQ